MFRAGQKLLFVFAGVLVLSAAAITAGAHTSRAPRNGATSARSSHVRTRSAAHRHHRRRSSGKRSKRLPNAKSLKNESW